MPGTLICRNCGNEARTLENGHRRKVFCGAECQRVWDKEQGRGHRPFRKPPTVFNCKHCQTEVTTGPGDRRTAFCGEECQVIWWSLNRRTGEFRTCAAADCDRRFYSPVNQNKIYCGRPCMYKYRTQRVYTHRRTRKSDGYVQVWLPGHPRASDGYVFEHVLVAEAALGRAILRGEEVHHRNRIPSDNRPENLIVLTGSAHAKLHAAENKASREAASWL